MQAQTSKEITGLLIAWSEGDESALDRLAPLIHSELHRLAHHYMSRRILVDFARERLCLKHGGGTLQVSLAEAASFVVHRNTDLVALDEALTALAAIDPRKVRVVEMRFFAGLSVEEVADVLKVSKETVMRDWRLAKVWLLRELEGKAVASEK
jgi:RNA polymerase sigma factor (sigma-70 family)